LRTKLRRYMDRKYDNGVTGAEPITGGASGAIENIDDLPPAVRWAMKIAKRP
jgi:hypothetical protein